MLMIFDSIRFLATYHHVRKSKNVFFVQKYSDDTYTSPDIDVTQISMGETGRQGFVCQGSNNVQNSILTLSCRNTHLGAEAG